MNVPPKVGQMVLDEHGRSIGRAVAVSHKGGVVVMDDCRSIPVRVPQRAPSEGPPGDLGEVVTADDLHRFEWVVRARVAAAVRSALASARKKQTAATSKGKT